MSGAALQVYDAQPVVADTGDAAQWAPVIMEAWGQSVRGIIETGRLLAGAKASLEHGDWGRLCDDLLPFGQRTAQRLMQIAAHDRLSNATHVSHLPPSWATLHALAALDGETFDAAIERGVISPTMERRQAQRLARAGSVEAFLAPVSAAESNDDVADEEEEEIALANAAALVAKIMRVEVPAPDLAVEAKAMIAAVATVTRCSVEALFAADRLHGRDRWRAVTARRFAVYLLHTECELSQPQAAKPFGLEASGASYMARDYEDYRAEPAFDRLMDRIVATQRAYLEDGAFE